MRNNYDPTIVPDGYEMIFSDDYNKKLRELYDRYLNNEDYDIYGLPKDQDYKEYLFLFEHPDLKYGSSEYQVQ